MFNAPEADAVTKPFLQLVRNAGYKYAKNGEISADTMSRLAAPMIPDDAYAAIVNGSI